MASAAVVPGKPKPLASLFKRLTTVPLKEVKLSVGLDIGSSSIKAVALGSRKGSGTRSLLSHQQVPITAGQETDASEAIKHAIAKLQVPTRTVSIGVSGQWVIMRVVEMPTMKASEMKQALPFEAQRYLPFNVQEVVIDGEILGQADANKMWVLIVACKRELLERRIDWVKRAGLEIAVIDVDALALANAFLSTLDSASVDGTRALLNTGAQLTNLVIFQRHVPYLVRDIPWGGDKLTRNLAEQMGIEASALAAQLAAPAPSPELEAALKTASETLVTEVQLSFDYFENRFGHPPAEVFLAGGLSLSAPFMQALKAHVAQPVNAWTPLRELSGQFAVAYGLALRTPS